MRLLLPPSETKRTGGRGRALEWSALSFSSLTEVRRRVSSALVELSADPDRAAHVLRLGATQRAQTDVNRELLTSATMPAIERYTGVLYDGLEVRALPAAAKRWIRAHVAIHTAPFGPVGAGDPIPDYRLAAATRLPGLPSSRALWNVPVSDALSSSTTGFVLDMRSEAYVALGPVPSSLESRYLRVVTQTTDGAMRAANHFNKRTKGLLVRSLAEDRPRVRHVDDLLAWADDAGWKMRDDGVEVQCELAAG